VVGFTGAWRRLDLAGLQTKARGPGAITFRHGSEDLDSYAEQGRLDVFVWYALIRMPKRGYHPGCFRHWPPPGVFHAVRIKLISGSSPFCDPSG